LNLMSSLRLRISKLRKLINGWLISERLRLKKQVSNQLKRLKLSSK
jgi:hypothetical protein